MVFYGVSWCFMVQHMKNYKKANLPYQYQIVMTT